MGSIVKGIYKREKISSERIEVESDRVHCEDIGLFILSKYPNLEYSNDDFFEMFDNNDRWSDFAIKTVIHTIAAGVINGKLEVYKYREMETFFWNLIKRDISSYYFELPQDKIDHDVLTNELFQHILNVKRYHYGRADFKRVMKKLIGYSQRSNKRISKEFLVRNFKNYAKKYSWLSIENKSGALNFILRKQKVDITKIYIPKLSIQITEIENKHNELLKSDREYCRFFIQIKSYLENLFSQQMWEN